MDDSRAVKRSSGFGLRASAKLLDELRLKECDSGQALSADERVKPKPEN
jgi:hypothetical protein